MCFCYGLKIIYKCSECTKSSEVATCSSAEREKVGVPCENCVVAGLVSAGDGSVYDPGKEP